MDTCSFHHTGIFMRLTLKQKCKLSGKTLFFGEKNPKFFTSPLASRNQEEIIFHNVANGQTLVYMGQVCRISSCFNHLAVVF